MMDEQTLVIASRNPHKIAELREALQGMNWKLQSALDFEELGEVEEDRHTLRGNAIKKATYVHEITGLPALADDTGLEVDALDGRPGVYSARYAGQEATDEQNVDKLLAELAGVNAESRSAQFRTVVAFVDGSQTHSEEGRIRGYITTERYGTGGFGYDPVFRPKDFEETFAQLPPATKQRIGHRGQAIAAFASWLRNKA